MTEEDADEFLDTLLSEGLSASHDGGRHYDLAWNSGAVDQVMALVNRVAAAEREACARVALADTSFDMLQDFGMQLHSAQLRTNIADAIRARGHQGD